MKKRVAVAAMAAVMAVSMMGMTSVAVQADDIVKIVTIGVQSGGSYWGNIEKGFTEACEELGWKVTTGHHRMQVMIPRWFSLLRTH